MTTAPKKVLSALEKVFAAEIEGRLPFQSKAAVYRDLLAAGLVAPMQRRFRSGWSAVTVDGYELTHAGRYLYCSNCKDERAENAKPGGGSEMSTFIRLTFAVIILCFAVATMLAIVTTVANLPMFEPPH